MYYFIVRNEIHSFRKTAVTFVAGTAIAAAAFGFQGANESYAQVPPTPSADQAPPRDPTPTMPPGPDVKPFVPAIDFLRKPDYQLSPEEVRNVGRLLEVETNFPTISLAGKLLEDNQQGLPIYNGTSRYFINESDPENPEKFKKIVLNTKSYNQASLNILDYSGDRVTITAQSNTGTVTLFSASNMTVREIQMSIPQTKGYSDFALKLVLSAEIMKYLAVDFLLSNAEKGIRGVTLSDDDRVKRGFFIYYFKENQLNGNTELYKNIPIGTSSLAPGFFSIFQLLPDYLKAKDQNKLTPTDIRGLGNYETASKYFLENGIITRDGDNYSYTTNAEARYTAELNMVGKLMNIPTVPAPQDRPQPLGPQQPTPSIPGGEKKL